jgi:hypothetical protein
MNAERWGVADVDSDTIEIHEQARPDDVDMLDLAMVEALRHHGSAYPLDPGELPDTSRPAAILRYGLPYAEIPLRRSSAVGGSAVR